jgi:hypothetical protein
MSHEYIKPTTIFEEGETEEFTLADKDYLLIDAIRKLALEVSKLRSRL